VWRWHDALRGLEAWLKLGSVSFGLSLRNGGWSLSRVAETVFDRLSFLFRFNISATLLQGRRKWAPEFLHCRIC
jgi:hypothetical protein